MRPSELQALLREKLDENALIHDMTDDGGHGLVRWSREVVFAGGHTEDGTGKRTETEHIVHRWAVKDTAGQDIPFMVYSGGYYNGPDADTQARADYRSRP